MDLLRRAYAFVHFRMKHHRPFQLAAQIAFFFLLAVQPLLIVLTALLAYLPLGGLEPRLASFFLEAFPGPTGEKLSALIVDVFERKNPGLLSFAAIALLWTASSGTKAVIDAMTRIRGLPADPRRWILVRLRAVGLTVLNVLLLAIGGSLAAGVVDVIERFLAAPHHAYHRWVELALGFLLMTGGVQVVYRYGPPPPRLPSLPGAVVAVISLVGTSFAVSTYVSHIRDMNAVYGSLGAVVVLMLWFFGVGFALVLGAEVNDVIYGWRGGREEESEARGAATRRSRPVVRHSLSSAS